MAELDKIGAERLREMILADCAAGLVPQSLCDRCRIYDIEEWLFPSCPIDFDLMDTFRWRDNHLSWLPFFRKFSTCSFCNLVLFRLAQDPNFIKLKFSAELACVQFTLYKIGTVITTDIGVGNPKNDMQRWSRWMMHENTARRIVRHLVIEGVSNGVISQACWFPRSTKERSQDNLLCWRPLLNWKGAIHARIPQL